MFRLLIAPGVTVNKWARMWAERVPDVPLGLVPGTSFSGEHAGLIRLPVDQDTFHAVPLYTEATVVVVPKDHFLAAADDVSMADFADEPMVVPSDDVLGLPSAADPPATTELAVALVAAEVGLLVVPQSLARLHHRKDLTYRVVTDAPTSTVALVWRRDGYTELVEELIGIVRGRTANSTRGRPPAPAASPPVDRAPRRTGTRRGSGAPRRR